MALPRIARLTVTAETGAHFLADITGDDGDALITLDAEDHRARHKLRKILRRNGVRHDVSYNVPNIFAVLCMGLKQTSLREAAEIIIGIFKGEYQELTITYWYFVDDGAGGEALLGAKIESFPQTVLFALTESDARSQREIWGQFDARVTDEFIGWTSVTGGSKFLEVRLTEQRYAQLEEALLELAGLFSFIH